MVDQAIKAAKIAAILDAVDRIREVLPPTTAQLRDDRTAREVLLLNLFVAIQEALSLASHWLSDAGWPIPPTYGEVFFSLADHNVLERSLAQRLVAAVGLRNLIAHQYAELDVDRIHVTATTGLDDLVAFVRSLS